MSTAEKVAIILATIGAAAVGIYVLMKKGLLGSSSNTSSSTTSSSTSTGAAVGGSGGQVQGLPPVIPQSPSSSSSSSGSSGSTSVGNSTGSAVTITVSGTSVTDPYARDIGLWSANPGGYISNGNWSAQPIVPTQVITNGSSVTFSLPSLPAHLWIAISSGMYYTWTVSVNVAGHVYTISGLNDQAQQVF